MKLIYYRDGEGKIIRYHLPPKELAPEQLEAEMAKFNKLGDTKVYAQEIEEGSLEMRLWEDTQKRRRFVEQTVEDAKDAIREALNAIECLEVAKE